MKFAFLLFFLSLPVWAKWSVSTYNIRNFDRDHSAGQTDLQELSKILQEFKSDVMAFEEVVNIKAFTDLISKNFPTYQYKISDCGGFGKQRLAVVYNPMTFEYINHFEDFTFSGNGSGCGSLRPVFVVSLKHKKDKEIYSFAAIHLKAGADDRAYAQRWSQYLKLEKMVENYADKNLILLGDFNTTGYILANEDFKKFENLLLSSNMRTMTEELGCTNYWKAKVDSPEFQSSILDHIVLQNKMVDAVRGVRVGAHCERHSCRPATAQELGRSFNLVSDHCPLQVTFN
jgi:endonuclease/exonuclease/phosphatase family metal-dependent hydrolase